MRVFNETNMTGKDTVFFVLILWIIVGAISPTFFYILFGFSILYWAATRDYVDLFIGLLLVLVLGDNLHSEMKVFNDIRIFYILWMFITIIIDHKAFIPYSTVHYTLLPFFVVALIC